MEATEDDKRASTSGVYKVAAQITKTATSFMSPHRKMKQRRNIRKRRSFFYNVKTKYNHRVSSENSAVSSISSMRRQGRKSTHLEIISRSISAASSMLKMGGEDESKSKIPKKNISVSKNIAGGDINVEAETKGNNQSKRVHVGVHVGAHVTKVLFPPTSSACATKIEDIELVPTDKKENNPQGVNPSVGAFKKRMYKNAKHQNASKSFFRLKSRSRHRRSKVGVIVPWAFNYEDTKYYLSHGRPIERFRAAAWKILYHDTKLDKKTQIELRFKCFLVAESLKKRFLTTTAGGKRRVKQQELNAEKKKAAQLKQFKGGPWKFCVEEGMLDELRLNLQFLERTYDSKRQLSQLSIVYDKKQDCNSRTAQRQDFEAYIRSMRGEYGETLLHGAILFNRTEVALYLLDQFPSLLNETYSERMYEGETALHIAIVNKNFELVQKLVEMGAQLNDDEISGPCRAVGDFFQRDNEAASVYYGETCLHFAVCTNQIKTVEYLVENGADLGAIDSNGNNVLHLCSCYELTKLYEILCNLVVRVAGKEARRFLESQRNTDGFTPMTLAAEQGSKDMLTCLIKRSRIIGWQFGSVKFLAYPMKDIDTSAANGVVETITTYGHHELLRIPIVKKVLDEKWRLFGRRMFLLHTISFFTYCGLFTYAYIDTEFDTSFQNSNHIWIWILVLIRSSFALLGFLIGFISTLNEYGEIIGLDAKHRIPIYFSAMFFMASGLGVTGVIGFMTGTSETFCLSLLGGSLILEWFYTLKFLMVGAKNLGQIIVSTIYIFEENVIYFAVIYLLLLFALAAPLSRFYGSDHGYLWWVVETFFLSVGFEPREPDEPEISFGFFTIKVIFGILHVIVLLNLLIAVMADTISKQLALADLVWLQSYADAVLEMEARCPSCLHTKVGVPALEAGMSTRDPEMRVITYFEVDDANLDEQDTGRDER